MIKRFLVMICAITFGVLPLGNAAEAQGHRWGKGASEVNTGTQVPTSEPKSNESDYDYHWPAVGVFTNAQVCANCHTASTDGSGVMRMPRTATGEDISPSAGWRHSMMALAWTDPFFQATVEDQASEFPDYAGDIEDKCLTCHSPMAHTDAHYTGIGLSHSDCQHEEGCYRMESSSRDDHAREGVSCTLCHQMVDSGIALPGSGSYSVIGGDDPAARTVFGPYPDPFSRPMQMNTGYAVKHSTYLSSSEHCASCHDLSTPTFDINTGRPAEPSMSFREQAPFAEWRNSLYGDGGADDESCQDCHMPRPEDYTTPIAVTPSGHAHNRWPERSNYSLHGVAGGNTYVLNLLKDWREELGIATSTTDVGFDRAIDNARDFLQTAATISLGCQSREASLLELCITINNLTGHKLPTGYPSRRMWIQLTVMNGDNDTLFDSGRPNDRGHLSVDDKHLKPLCMAKTKESAFKNSQCFEPHRDIITQEAEVAIYEAAIADSNRNITYSLLYGAGYLKDNRIPPRGFSSSGASYDRETAVVGKANNDPDFNRLEGVQGSGSDTVKYRLTIAEDYGPLRVQARLWYQSIRPGFVEALKHGGGKVTLMRDMYERKPPLPELLALDIITIP